MIHISDIKLIRTDTTLDLSQKAEKGMLCIMLQSAFKPVPGIFISFDHSMWDKEFNELVNAFLLLRVDAMTLFEKRSAHLVVKQPTEKPTRNIWSKPNAEPMGVACLAEQTTGLVINEENIAPSSTSCINSTCDGETNILKIIPCLMTQKPNRTVIPLDSIKKNTKQINCCRSFAFPASQMHSLAAASASWPLLWRSSLSLNASLFSKFPIPLVTIYTICSHFCSPACWINLLYIFFGFCTIRRKIHLITKSVIIKRILFHDFPLLLLWSLIMAWM